ncbi:MAG: hypothetical protein UW24_C0008G0023 [Parcubacteria group bacterium GW2011_GWA2_44_12]|nr:MAG: hypothetical protein UW24_C0008G0023 [Parcubacteria group bacterium GW2011_GWA2_44_12]
MNINIIFGIAVLTLLFMIARTLEKIAERLQDLRDDLNGNNDE